MKHNSGVRGIAGPVPLILERSRLLKTKLSKWVDEYRRGDNHLPLLLSLVIGALVGLVVVAFILLTGRLAARMYPAGGSGWRRILVPTLGSLGTGYLLSRYFPYARGSGIPQTKFALFIQDGYISLRTVLGKFFCCSASLASGIALGREGPSVQIGAGLSSVLSRRLGLNTEQVKSLVPVGCSAALAAAFNTPIAAVLFSLEEIMGDLHAPVLGSVVLSSATSWMVLHLVLGDEPLFHVAGYHLVHPSEFLIYAALGVIGGLGSVAFVKLLLGFRARFLKMPKWTVWFQPVAGGLTVGVMGFFVPEVLGVGYDIVDKALNGDLVLGMLVSLAVLKIVATALCYGSGNAGGIFGPSLFMGAMIGGSVGSVAHTLLPAYTAEPGAYALVGMGTAFAGVVRTPLTSVIMIFEVTRDYTIIVPLMISNLIAFFISHKLQRQPIYEALAEQDGVRLPTRESRALAGRLQVSHAVRPVSDEPSPDLGSLPGLGSPEHSRDAATLPFAHLDDSLSVVLERMGATGRSVLPVVSRADSNQVIGIVTLPDILRAYGVAKRSEPEE